MSSRYRSWSGEVEEFGAKVEGHLRKMGAVWK